MEITREEIEEYLADIKRAINLGRYQISARDKNRQLYLDYVFSETQCKQVLLSLTADDFSEAVRNDHPKYSEEILYIFGKDVLLLPRFGGEEERVSLYIKFNKLQNHYLIVISFHKQEFPLRYKFR